MAKFKKRPVIVDVEQFFAARKPWPEGVFETDTVRLHGPLEAPGQKCWAIQTLEGPYVVSEGDWIITGIKGERYPCKPDIFQSTYEPAGQ